MHANWHVDSELAGSSYSTGFCVVGTYAQLEDRRGANVMQLGPNITKAQQECSTMHEYVVAASVTCHV